MKKLLLILACTLFTTTQPQIIDNFRGINMKALKAFVLTHRKECGLAVVIIASIYLYHKFQKQTVDANTQTGLNKPQIVSPQFVPHAGTPSSPFSPRYSPASDVLETQRRLMVITEDDRDYIDNLKQNLASQTKISSPSPKNRK